MIDVSVDIEGLSEFQDYVEYIKRLATMTTDIKFQKYIQEKCLETINEVARERVPIFVGQDGDPNANLLEEYILRNEVEEIENGFIIKNSFTLPPEMLAISENKIENYAEGFNVALAFEYGVGIVGENNAIEGAWDYNVNDYNWAWRYVENGNVYSSWGYAGAEVYRFSKEKITESLNKWVDDYYKKEVK